MSTHISFEITDAATKASSSPSPGSGGSRARIFVVDDERPIVMLVATFLRREGFEVDTETDSEGALAKISTDPAAYDVLITDNDMPVLSGVALIRELRQAGFHGRVLMQSGNILGDEQSVKKNTGADAFLQKPCKLKAIAAKVHELMAASSRQH